MAPFQRVEGTSRPRHRRPVRRLISDSIPKSVSALAVGALAFSLAQVLAPASASEPTAPAEESPVAIGNYELTASGDTFVQSGLDGSSKPSSPELKVGTSNAGINKARSYLTFDVASVGTIDPESVLSATVTV